ncbi:MAG: CinA family protein [Phycisphaerales bacterium]|nr:CinA family protein [Phycisphaerales bacterium]
MSIMNDPVRALIPLLSKNNETVCSVESCTGGMLGMLLTELPGSSKIYRGGVVTYSDALKTTLADVPAVMIEINGAVAAPVAIAMAKGGLAKTGATHALSITGVAGPDGGTEEKPVGTVWICRASSDGTHDCRRFVFPGDRAWIRKAAATNAVCMLILHLMGQKGNPMPHEQERA